MSEFFGYMSANSEFVTGLFIEHIQLTIMAIAIAILIGVPLGIFITYFSPAKRPVMAMTNIIQAIPSMALLGFMIPLFGIGTKPATVMVTLYSLLPIIKNTVAGLNNINPDTIEAAKGIGLDNFQILYKVQIPLAAPVIMAGVRISAVSAVGLMTLAAFIGAGGLGYLVYSGIRTVNNAQILAGAVPACILALLIDYIFSVLETIVTPKNLQISSNTSKFKTMFNRAVVIILCIGLGTSFVFGIVGSKNSDKEITIGSMDFTEQEILSNMAKLYIEDKTDIKVNQSLSLGASSIVMDALTGGSIDMYFDYTGTLFGSFLSRTDSNDADEIYKIVKKDIKKEYGVNVLSPLNFSNTYTLAMKKDTAEKYNITSISDLARSSSNLILSPTLTFVERPDCLVGLQKAYPLNFKDIIPIDGSPRYTALMSGECDIVDAYSTDGLLKKFDLKVLEDDKSFFLPYDAVPVVNDRIMEDFPELDGLFKEMAKHLNEEAMIELNYRVDELKEKPEDVARDFLIQEGLIEK